MELLNRGSDPLIGFRDDRSALQIAIRSTSYEMVQMLVDFIVPGVNPCGDPDWLTHILPELEPGPPEDEWMKRTWWETFFVVMSLKRCACLAVYHVPP